MAEATCAEKTKKLEKTVGLCMVEDFIRSSLTIDGLVLDIKLVCPKPFVENRAFYYFRLNYRRYFPDGEVRHGSTWEFAKSLFIEVSNKNGIFGIYDMTNDLSESKKKKLQQRDLLVSK